MRPSVTIEGSVSKPAAYLEYKATEVVSMVILIVVDESDILPMMVTEETKRSKHETRVSINQLDCPVHKHCCCFYLAQARDLMKLNLFMHAGEVVY